MALPTTPRLLIRPLTLEDQTALIPILCDKTVMEFSTGPLSQDQIKTWLQDRISEYEHPGFSVWALILKDQNKLIGFAGIRPLQLDGHTEIELIFRLATPYWGQGLATEASLAIIDYAFHTLAINNLVAIADPKNSRSLRVIEKLKMAYEKDSIYKGFPIRVYRLYKFKNK